MGMMEKLEKIHKYIIELKSQNKKQSEKIKEQEKEIKELEDKLASLMKEDEDSWKYENAQNILK